MEKINGRKLSLIFIFILILLVIALLVGKFTYSYLGPTISDDLETQGEVTASGDTLIFTKGNNLSLSATTDNFTTGGTNLSTTTNPKVKLVASTKTNQASATYYVGVVINSNLYTYTTSDNTAEVILTIKDENGSNVTSGVDGLTYVTSGGVSGFDVTGKTGLFNIKTDYPISTTSSSTGTTHTWTFTLTFVNLGTDQSENENAKMSVDIYLQKSSEFPSTLADVCSDGDNLSECITTLSQKSVSPVSKIYYHDSTLANGAGDNSYRYAGASESVNNFVCFGSTASPCPIDNLYRIIGVMDNKVKLIKYDYMTTSELGTDGDYSMTGKEWKMDSSYKGTYGDGEKIGVYHWNNNAECNTWSTSLLNKTNLNTNFINNIGNDWSNKIAVTTWKVGGNTWAKVGSATPAMAYQNEITIPDATNSTDNATEYEAKVGLMYVSDYGFAAMPSDWTKTMSSYSSAINNNWMYMGLYEYTITRISDDGDFAFSVYDNGNIDIAEAYRELGNSDGAPVRVTFNLQSSVTYVSGSGSMSDPVRMK